MKHTKNRKLLLYITVGAIFLLVFLRFGLFFLKSEGFSGLSVGIPLLLLGVVIFAFCTSGFLAAWVYEDCGKRGDDPILWAIVVLVATPLDRMDDLFSASSGNKKGLSRLRASNFAESKIL